MSAKIFAAFSRENQSENAGAYLPNFSSSDNLVSSFNIDEDGDHKSDLENAKESEKAGARSKNHGFGCNGCGVRPIIGDRYHCSVRPDYDLCTDCEIGDKSKHSLVKIPGPTFSATGSHSWSSKHFLSLQRLEEETGEEADDNSVRKLIESSVWETLGGAEKGTIATLDLSIVTEEKNKGHSTPKPSSSLNKGTLYYEKYRPVIKYFIREVFYTGSMPNFQEYIYRRSFFHFDANDRAKKYHNLIRFIMTIYVGISIILRGVSQVYLCNHPLTGLCICIGLYMTSVRLLVYVVMGTLVSTIAGVVITLPHFTEVAAGLVGYDGALIGAGVCTFIKQSQVLGDEDNEILSALNSRGMAIVVLLSTICGVVHMAAKNMSDMPALTLAFNIVLIVFLMILGDGKSNVTSLSWGPDPDDDASTINVDQIAFTGQFLYDAAIRGVGQFIFIPSTSGGWMVVLGIAICNRWAAMAVVLGSMTGALTARSVMRVPHSAVSAIQSGLYGFCPAGTAAALGGNVFYRPSFFSMLIAIFAAGMTTFFQLGFESLMYNDKLQLPVCTVPFCIATWLMMVTRSAWLDPIAGEGEDFDDVLHRSNKIEDMVVLDPNIVQNPTILVENIANVVKKNVVMRQEGWKSRDVDSSRRRNQVVNSIKRIPSFSLITPRKGARTPDNKSGGGGGEHDRISSSRVVAAKKDRVNTPDTGQNSGRASSADSNNGSLPPSRASNNQPPC